MWAGRAASCPGCTKSHVSHIEFFGFFGCQIMAAAGLQLSSAAASSSVRRAIGLSSSELRHEPQVSRFTDGACACRHRRRLSEPLSEFNAA